MGKNKSIFCHFLSGGTLSTKCLMIAIRLLLRHWLKHYRKKKIWTKLSAARQPTSICIYLPCLLCHTTLVLASNHSLSKPWVGKVVMMKPDWLGGLRPWHNLKEVLDVNYRLLHIKQLLLVTANSMQIPNMKLAATFYHDWFNCACQSSLKAVLQLTQHFYQPWAWVQGYTYACLNLLSVFGTTACI